MQILDQDREYVYPANLEALTPEYVDCGAINLMMKTSGRKVLLGTFDDLAELRQEMEQIRDYEGEVYIVSGYYESDYE